MTLAFVACVERGPLEAQALLLARSLRRFGGRFAEAPLHLFQPRAARAIRPETRAGLEALGARVHAAVLNRRFSEVGVLNKVYACARAEAVVEAEVLVFVDTDTIFVGEPSALALPEGLDAAVRPAQSHGLGSTGPGDPHEPFWQRLYQLCRLTSAPFVVATRDKQRIRAYFNSGLVAVRRRAGLFAQWKKDLERLADAGHVPEVGLKAMDELALAATLGHVFERVWLLDARYNYVVPGRPRFPEPVRSMPLDDLIHLHYRFWFNRPDFMRIIRPAFDPTCEIMQWLDQHLPLLPTHQTRVPNTPPWRVPVESIRWMEAAP